MFAKQRRRPQTQERLPNLSWLRHLQSHSTGYTRVRQQRTEPGEKQNPHLDHHNVPLRVVSKIVISCLRSGRHTAVQVPIQIEALVIGHACDGVECCSTHTLEAQGGLHRGGGTALCSRCWARSVAGRERACTVHSSEECVGARAPKQGGNTRPSIVQSTLYDAFLILCCCIIEVANLHHEIQHSFICTTRLSDDDFDPLSKHLTSDFQLTCISTVQLQTPKLTSCVACQ